MPPAIIDQLNALRDSLSIVLDSGEPALGEPYVARVVSGSEGPLSVLDVVTSSLSLDALLKNVIWNNALPEESLDSADLAGNILGGLPLELMRPLLVLLGSDGSILDPGGSPTPIGDLTPTDEAPGLLGQLRTTLDLPTGISSPVALSVQWSITDSEGEDLTPGTDYSAPAGLIGTAVSVLLAPQLVPLGAPPSTTTYTLRASITLRVGSESVTHSLEIPLVVPQLPIPRLVAMFRHPNFDPIEDGFALIIVPPGSPIGTVGHLTSVLAPVRTALGTLRTFANLVSLGLGLGQLLDAIAGQPVENVVVRFAEPVPARAPALLPATDGASPPVATSEYYDIGDFAFRGWSIWRNSLGAEDAVRSLIYLGPPGSGVRCYNDHQGPDQRAGTAWETDQGVFDLTSGTESFAMLRTLPLYASDPPVERRAEPAGATATTVVPPGSRRDTYNITGFNNEISSLRFI